MGAFAAAATHAPAVPIGRPAGVSRCAEPRRSIGVRSCDQILTWVLRVDATPATDAPSADRPQRGSVFAEIGATLAFLRIAIAPLAVQLCVREVTATCTSMMRKVLASGSRPVRDRTACRVVMLTIAIVEVAEPQQTAHPPQHRVLLGLRSVRIAVL